MNRCEFMDILTEQIRCKRALPLVTKEIEAHIDDQKAEFLAEGMMDAEAEEAAVREMGDPVGTGIMLDRVHRPRMEWSIFGSAVILSLVGLALQIMVLTADTPIGSENWFIGIWNGIEKNILGMAVGVAIMLAVCWIDYSVVGKYAVSLWIAANVLLVIALMGPVVNGRPRWAIPVSYLVIPFYAGLVYHFRGQGQKGFFKSIAALCISVGLMSMILAISGMFIMGTVAIVILHVAIHKKWFGNKRKGLYLKLWGVMILIPVLWAVVNMAVKGYVLADYQVNRIVSCFHPGSRSEYNYVLTTVRQAGEAARDGVKQIAETDGIAESYIRNDYLWIYLFTYLGVGRGLGITIVILLFIGLLFYKVRKEKNQLGYMMSLSCTLFLALQTLLYIGMNFEVVPFGNTYMPFMSNGVAVAMITYFYMGIMLSVYRNRNVVKN